MKPPKNFYSNLDRRKQGLPELPEASTADAGKVLGVDNNGAWELNKPNLSIIEVSTDSVYNPTKINLVGGMTANDFLNLAKRYKDNLIIAKDDDGNALYFRQLTDVIDPNQRILYFYSIGMNYGKVDRIFNFSVSSGTSTQFTIFSKTLK